MMKLVVMLFMWALLAAIAHDVHNIARDVHILASPPAGEPR